MESQSELKVGDKVKIESGGEAVVCEMLGRSGREIYYLVEYNGENYVLNWYIYEKLFQVETFRENLVRNISDGPPENSDSFLWPQYLTDSRQYSTFGYLTNLIPSKYMDFDKLYIGYEWKKTSKSGEKAIKKVCRFASLDALMEAVINIVKAFQALHLAGKIYQTLDGGTILIHPETGKVLMRDCDNITPEGEKWRIGGFPGFMAPELITSEVPPRISTERYLIAVLLFRLFMRADPLEGKRVLQSIVLLEYSDLKFYGKEPLFIYDPQNDANRPVRGVHNNAILLWRLYPPYIREAFIISFTDGLKSPEKRLDENQWLRVLHRLRETIKEYWGNEDVSHKKNESGGENMGAQCELKAGDRVRIESGGEAVVRKELGRGGQGIVYLVEYNRKEYALKWYFYDKLSHPEEFRRNLAQNIADGAPENSSRFLWPQYLTDSHQYPTFGYLMNVAPSEYVDLDKLYMGYEWKKPPVKGQNAIKKTYKFESLDAQVTAAINIVKAFRSLHLAGKSYQDLNGGGFFISPKTGDVLVCDCDNVAPDGENFGIGGFPGFMAPEIVRGVAKPDVLTDRHSLAVVLFRLFMRADPLEGKRVLQSVVLTEANDLKFYGKEPVFIYDPKNDSNRPVRGVHDNAIKLWKLYPSYIREVFISAFTDGLKDPNKRVIEKRWQELLIRLRSDIIHCPGCDKVTYSTLFDHQEHYVCVCRKCGSKIYTLQIKDMLAPLYPGLKLYRCYTENVDDYETITGEVVENKNRRGIFGIKNLSKNTWRAKFPDNSVRDIHPGNGVPIWRGLQIDFGDGIGARILS